MRHRKALIAETSSWQPSWLRGRSGNVKTPLLEKDRQDNHSSGSKSARQHRNSVMPVRSLAGPAPLWGFEAQEPNTRELRMPRSCQSQPRTRESYA